MRFLIYFLLSTNLYAWDGYHIDLSEIIYLNKNSMHLSMNGAEGIKALGNYQNRRKYYEETDRSDLQKRAYLEIEKTIGDLFPFAVIVDGRLYNKDDDHCTKMPDTWRGVNIVDSCQTHDYCYYQLADYKKFNYDMKKAFYFCHTEFIRDARKQTKEQLPNKKRPLFALTHYLGVKYIPYSWTNYQLNQDKSAIMTKKILDRAQSDEEFAELILESKVIDLPSMESEYNDYCRAHSQMKKEKLPEHRLHPRDNLKPSKLRGCL